MTSPSKRRRPNGFIIPIPIPWSFKVGIGARNVHRVLYDCGSTVNILSYDVYQKMGLRDKDLIPTISHVYGFTRDASRVRGMVKL